MKNILILGGGGYKGTPLVNYLIKKNYKVRVIDNFWFGNYFKQNINLEIFNKDIRDISDLDFNNIDKVIHLANIANDPSVELDPSMSWEINVLSSKKIIELSIKNKIKQFIYASSGSVYGVKDELEVTEDLELVPISIYNKTKMISERVLMSYKDEIKIHSIRPATVCGYSERMRLDISVNILTYQALKDKSIKVFGGKQIRPNINIKDMIRVYEFFLDKNLNIPSGFYNAGFENMSILEVANIIKKKLDTKINILESNDIRSYRLSSKKLLSLGFKPFFNVEDAINEIIYCYKNGFLDKIENMSNINWIKKNQFE